MSAPTTIAVEGAAPYEVVLGHGVAANAADAVPAGARQVAILHADPVATLAHRIAAAAEERGVTPLLVPLPDAEDAKSAATAIECWSQLGQATFTRSDAIIGVGGGATTDLSGFIAATWLRGVAHIPVPTTLLGMVDAAVGGKTGINTAEGKNLVGSFHEPVAVVCDLDLLTTLPAADYAAGLAEVIKCGFIRDPRILDLVEADPNRAVTAGGPDELELISRAVQVKADVVAADLREATTVESAAGRPRVTGREMLNYGHTFGHALEQAEDYRWRHGDAVSVGMVYVAELARACGLIDASLVARHRDILTAVGLPVTYSGASYATLAAAMGRDKKSRGSVLRFVALEGVADPVILAAPAESALIDAFDCVSR